MENIAFKGICTAQIAQFQLLFFIPLYYTFLLNNNTTKKRICVINNIVQSINTFFYT